ncbi:ubiquitin-specific protease doa [Salix suchowensis]|nr:ubiquitin-specific protease doa [Salix suchowensis]
MEKGDGGRFCAAGTDEWVDVSYIEWVHVAAPVSMGSPVTSPRLIDPDNSGPRQDNEQRTPAGLSFGQGHGEHRSTMSVDHVSHSRRHPAETSPSFYHSPPEVHLHGVLRYPVASFDIGWYPNNLMQPLSTVIINHISSIPSARHSEYHGPLSGSPFVSPPAHYDNIASPPQASINPSFPRRRSDYIDQTQEALSGSGIASRGGPIDYPELSTQISRPAPVAAPAIALDRQDNHNRSIAMPQPTVMAPLPPRLKQDYSVVYWYDTQIGTSGLKNMGNTCYMNAPIQCLSATVPFAQFFTTRFSRVPEFLVGHHTRGFEPGYHETSMEDDSGGRSGAGEAAPQIASEREWKAWKMRNDSLIVDYFQGQLRNRLECMTCHQVRRSFSYEPMQDLSISRRRRQRTMCSPCCNYLSPAEAARYICRSVWTPSSTTRSWRRMMRGLSHSFISRLLCGNPCSSNRDCPRCKTKRKATKQLSLARLPPILLIHLKRFETRGRFSDKIDTFVEYPLKALDLTNFMPPPLPTGADKGQVSIDPSDPRTQLPPYRYDLYGVTNHYGNLSSGHCRFPSLNVYRLTNPCRQTRPTLLRGEVGCLATIAAFGRRILSKLSYVPPA